MDSYIRNILRFSQKLISLSKSQTGRVHRTIVLSYLELTVQPRFTFVRSIVERFYYSFRSREFRFVSLWKSIINLVYYYY